MMQTPGVAAVVAEAVAVAPEAEVVMAIPLQQVSVQCFPDLTSSVIVMSVGVVILLLVVGIYLGHKKILDKRIEQKWNETKDRLRSIPAEAALQASLPPTGPWRAVLTENGPSFETVYNLKFESDGTVEGEGQDPEGFLRVGKDGTFHIDQGASGGDMASFAWLESSPGKCGSPWKVKVLVTVQAIVESGLTPVLLQGRFESATGHKGSITLTYYGIPPQPVPVIGQPIPLGQPLSQVTEAALHNPVASPAPPVAEARAYTYAVT
mmetsp:Transcript_47634/g.103399  ORF Transcript_47634/g.103399 Transcript_47634/m.103399 type:complete len:265 (+) Transcript_47634:62-856(+)